MKEKVSLSKIVMIGLLFILVLISFLNFTKIEGTILLSPLDEDGNLETAIQDYTGEGFSFFLTKQLSETTLTSNASKGDMTINVLSTVNCTNFKAINIYDDESYYQGLILSTTATTINLTSNLDRDWDLSNTIVECAEWDLSTVDGSAAEEIFKINPPTNRSWHITNTIIKITDNSDWDLSKFGGGSPLSNGISGRITDGYEKDLFLIYDNSGFSLRGFDIVDFAKAPAGVYGFTGSLDFRKIYGNVIQLDGKTFDQWQAVVRDDLTTQTEIAITINGHYIND